MHVRMSAYIGKNTNQKYMHLSLLRTHEFVHTHTPTYNLRHSARKYFNTQIHTHTNTCMHECKHTHIHTHTNTGVHACMQTYINTHTTDPIRSKKGKTKTVKGEERRAWVARGLAERLRGRALTQAT